MDVAVAVVGPALLAGIVAIGATVAIERFGGVLGGFLGTLPTTIVPASLGIAAASTSSVAFADAMGAVPLGMLANAGFLWLWRVAPSRLPDGELRVRLAAMLAISMAGWAALASVSWAALTATRAAGGSVLVVGAVALGANVLVGAAACWRAVPAPRGRRPVRFLTLLARGALAAAAIAASSGLALAGVDLIAGIASVFPAIFVTTMVSLWWSQGQAVPAGAVGPMMLGSSAVGAYALLAAATFGAVGPALGAVAAWGLAVIGVTVPAVLWMDRRHPSG